MKMFLISLLLAGFSPWARTTIARASDEGGESKQNVVVVCCDKKVVAGDHKHDGQGHGAHTKVIRLRKSVGGDHDQGIHAYHDSEHNVIVGDEEVFFTDGGEGHVVVRINVEEDGDDGRSEPELIWVSKKGEKKGRGWLGVSIGIVPEALAVQLEIEGGAIMVQNVVDDSPADDAGLRIHDIILSVDDEAVEGKVGRAVNLIKSHESGEEVDLVILRGGREKVVSVTLGSRPDVTAKKFSWKFEVAPDVEVKERIRTRAKVLRRDSDNKWVFEDLGDLEVLKELPKHIQMFVPKSGDALTKIFMSGEEKKIVVNVTRDGGAISVSREGDGPITVTRTDDSDRETTQTYDDEDDLAEEDEEAFEVWSKATDSATIHLNLDGLGEGLGDLDFDFDFDFDADEFLEHAEDWKEHAEEWKEHMHEWRAQFEEGLGGAHEAYQEAMEELHETLKELKESDRMPHGLEKLHQLAPMFLHKDGRSEALRGFKVGHFGRPKHTFEVRVDGTIEVRIRKGDSQLVQLYEDEDDLARRSPRLFEKFEKLMEIEEE